MLFGIVHKLLISLVSLMPSLKKQICFLITGKKLFEEGQKEDVVARLVK